MARDDELERERRDRAGVGPSPRRSVRLVPMKELDHYKVADGEPDVRGWEVRTVSGREIGEIDDLLVDTTTNEVVMLDVDLRGSDAHTLAPVRAVQLDREKHIAIIDSADLQGAEDVPALRRDAAPSEEETRRFGDRYDRVYGERGFERDRDYRVSCPDGELCFEGSADREVPRTTERADEAASAAADALHAGERRERREPGRVSLRRESDQRQPTSGGASAAAGAAAGDEVVVQRRPVVVEEVVVRRRVVNEDEPRARNDERPEQGP